MNPYLSCNLVKSHNSCFPCMESFHKTIVEVESGEQQEYKQNFRANKEEKNSMKRCTSSPENGDAYYSRQQPRQSFGKTNEMKHKLRRFPAEDVHPNEAKKTRSTEKLKEFLITHADFLDSLYEKHKSENDEQPKDEAKSLPAELWWVPPLKLPTTRSVPSVAMSNSYSAASSTSTHPKTRRSVEDLRQRVDSVCNLVEAMGIIEIEQKSLEHNPQVLTTRSTDFSIPLLKIPSTASQASSRVEELKPHTSYKTVGSQCTMIEPKFSAAHNNNSNNTADSTTLRVQSDPTAQYISASHANNAVRVASAQDASSRYDNPQSSLSVSDLACIHIVNPMLSKLARLCTAQGQQYLNVLEELEKACNDFHNACKYQGAAK